MECIPGGGLEYPVRHLGDQMPTLEVRHRAVDVGVASDHQGIVIQRHG